MAIDGAVAGRTTDGRVDEAPRGHARRARPPVGLSAVASGQPPPLAHQERSLPPDGLADARHGQLPALAGDRAPGAGKLRRQSGAAVAVGHGRAPPSSAAVLGRSDCVGNRSGVRADGMHATLPGLHRPPRADDTHRGHRRRRCVAGTDGRRARTNRRTANRSERPERRIHQELESRSPRSSRTLPPVPQQRHRGHAQVVRRAGGDL